jgi:hypothetical protein
MRRHGTREARGASPAANRAGARTLRGRVARGGDESRRSLGGRVQGARCEGRGRGLPGALRVWGAQVGGFGLSSSFPPVESVSDEHGEFEPQ